MRVVTHKTKKGISYYIIRDVTKNNGKRSTETLRDLGNLTPQIPRKPVWLIFLRQI